MEVNDWFVIRTAPGAERIAMRKLHALGIASACPMQVIVVDWHGRTCESVVPLMAGCLFLSRSSCEGKEEILRTAGLAFVVDASGERLRIEGSLVGAMAVFAERLEEQ